jgi:hypothetical protein
MKRKLQIQLLEGEEGGGQGPELEKTVRIFFQLHCTVDCAVLAAPTFMAMKSH